MPNSLTIFGEVSTDNSKKVIVDFSYQYDNSGNNSATSYQISPGFSVRPIQVLKLGVTADYSDNRDNLQYVAARNYLTQKRYILGTINQQTLGLTFRVDLNISPEFSIQYYGSPFVSKGTYSAFKVVTNPEARSYSDRFNPLFTQLSGNNYILQDLSDIPYPQYSIGNPDFNFHEFRSNLVAKWEYRLGSFIYFVWSNERSGRTPSSLASFGDSYKELQKVFPNNIFLIKLNYWFTL
jgi:hypothetical protein